MPSGLEKTEGNGSNGYFIWILGGWWCSSDLPGSWLFCAGF